MRKALGQSAHLSEHQPPSPGRRPSGAAGAGSPSAARGPHASREPSRGRGQALHGPGPQLSLPRSAQRVRHQGFIPGKGLRRQQRQHVLHRLSSPLEHQRTHPGEKPCRRQGCGKAFRPAVQPPQRRRVHPGEKARASKERGRASTCGSPSCVQEASHGRTALRGPGVRENLQRPLFPGHARSDSAE